MVAAATAEAAIARQPSSKCERRKSEEASSLKGPPNPFGKSASDGLSPSISTADSVGSC